MRKIVSLFALIVIPLLGFAHNEAQIVDRYEYAEVLGVRQAVERQQVEVQHTVCQQKSLPAEGSDDQLVQPFDSLEQGLLDFAEQVLPSQAAQLRFGRSREARVCQTVNEYVWRDVIVGYDVRVLYKGNMYDVRTATDPGARLKFKVVLVPDE
ncbi:hypothetical protein [Salinibius halmophilus]|uniref:hypothetical protein n=1 Tax=Salinibius halmophilus TaxID=1853216 RepID=UPI000E662AC1|nr:hypothetical protein [Salinibius halmophilus]